MKKRQAKQGGAVKAEFFNGLLALLAVGSLFGGETAVQNATLRVCTADGYLPPLNALVGESRVQRNIREAAAQVGWQVTFAPRPWRRCLKEVAEGQLDAIVGAAPAEENLSRMTFPMAAGQLDITRAVAEVAVVAYRPLGSRANWNGERFSGLEGPVLYIGGGVFMAEALGKRGVSASGAGRQPEHLLEMLLAGRSNLAVDLEMRVMGLLQRDEFRGRFEVLPTPFAYTPIFTPISPGFYAANRDRVERFWTILGRLQPARRSE